MSFLCFQKILLRHKEMSEKARVMMEKLKQNSMDGKAIDEDYVGFIYILFLLEINSND